MAKTIGMGADRGAGNTFEELSKKFEKLKVDLEKANAEKTALQVKLDEAVKLQEELKATNEKDAKEIEKLKADLEKATKK